MKKLNSSRGETLVEVLASILIASLSVTMLFGCIMASSRIDREAKEMDKDYYAALTAAETQSAAEKTGTVSVANPVGGQSETLNISIYGGEGLYSYKKAAGS